MVSISISSLQEGTLPANKAVVAVFFQIAVVLLHSVHWSDQEVTTLNGM
jgi:hypothetical protein